MSDRDALFRIRHDRPYSRRSILRICLLTALLATANAVQATVFVVSTTADAGPGSLRQSILNANAQIVTGSTACAPHQINFNIPGSGTRTIRPLSPLPPVLITITFDGFSQPGAVPNTAFQGNNSVLIIELDGTLAGAADGLQFSATPPGSPGCTGNGSVVRGLVINRFQGAAIRNESPCFAPTVCQVGGLRIVGNFIGTDVTGNLALGNGFGATLSPGIVFGANSTRNIVGDEVIEDGGPLDPFAGNRNVISGNALDGIYVGSTPPRESASDHRIRNNTIGLKAAGTAALPNGRNGVFADVGSDGTQVQDSLISANAGDGIRMLANTAFANLLRNGIGTGENGEALGNGGNGVYVGGNSTAVTVSRRYRFTPFAVASISNNGGAGVYVTDTAIVDAVVASSADNAGLAFDLAPPGVNANDNLDADAGPNELLNTPVITSAVLNTTSMVGTITGTINTTPGVRTEINFFFNDTCEANGHGGARTPFNDNVLVAVTPDAQGNASFIRNAPFVPLGKFLTAQARRFSATAFPPALVVSELSACRQVIALTDQIFADDFE